MIPVYVEDLHVQTAAIESLRYYYPSNSRWSTRKNYADTRGGNQTSAEPHQTLSGTSTSMDKSLKLSFEEVWTDLRWTFQCFVNRDCFISTLFHKCCCVICFSISTKRFALYAYLCNLCVLILHYLINVVFNKVCNQY